jgi:hypothetical protein
MSLFVAWSQPAQAIPLFNRQTGQNCVACHAGGQFPELTPYGRLFKMTGYTIGQRALPVSAMVLISASQVSDTSKSDDPGADFQKDGSLTFSTASLFLGGKVTDNIGAFAQITFDPYAVQGADGSFHGHTNADNIDLRYADRFVDANRDLIVGVSVNNNPSVSDPWNTAPAWNQYVPVPSPTSSRFIDGNSPYPGYAAGGNIAGVTAYAFWNQTIYGEIGAYRTANGMFSFMSAGLDDASITKMRGLNPYWRLAWNHAWGANSLMLGTSGMASQLYDDPLDSSAGTHKFRDLGLDAQYQYLLDPHAVTAQLVYARSRVVDGNTTTVLRAKGTYVYQAKYGGSLSLFNLTGTTDPANIDATRVSGNATGDPATRGWSAEAFWTPIQYVRLGAQYTAYGRYNGSSSNYDGAGRNARDNNSLFFYLWAAY